MRGKRPKILPQTCVVIAALKSADDGDGRIVRLHETFGGRRRVRLRSPGTTRAQRVDLLKQPLEAEPLPVLDVGIELELRPFELVTLRSYPFMTQAAHRGVAGGSRTP
jgi:alpha-mannosidase